MGVLHMGVGRRHVGALHMGAYGFHVGHWAWVCTWWTWRTLHIGAGREHMGALHMGVVPEVVLGGCTEG